MPSAQENNPLRFGVFQLNHQARELRKHGVRIRLSGQPFTILSMLLEKPGQIVTREELQSRVWPADTFVDFEQGLNSAMKKLRTALSDSAENPRYIETLPRIGYRFIAPVSFLEEAESSAPPAIASPQISQSEEKQPQVVGGASIRTARRVWVIAAVLLLAVTAGLFSYAKRTPVLLTSKDTIVLADFENSTKEPVFDDALHQGLLVGMEQSPFFQVLSDRKAALILKQMGRASDERLLGHTAIELCHRAGSKIAVQGSVANLGTTYLVALTAYRCDNSEALVHEQAEAKRKEEVLSALEQATTRLRKRLGESIASIAKYNAPIEQATTPSLDALNAYGTAIAISDREGDRSAIPFYNRAIELDPNFAMAYGRLAAIYDNLGESQLANENASKAFAHVDHATESEKLLIEAWYNIHATGNLEKAAELLELWRQSYPATHSVLNDLGAVYGNLGRYEKGTEILRESLQLDSSDATTYANLADGLLALNRADDAKAVLADASKQKLQTDYLLEAQYWNGFLQHDAQEMEQAVALASSVDGAQALLLADKANTEAYYGRFAKAREFTESAANLLVHDGDKESAALCLAVAAVREAEIGEAVRARNYTTKALQLARNANTLALAALVAAQAGDHARAQALLEELDKAHSNNTLIQKYWFPTIRARIALQQKKPLEALQILDANAPYDKAVAPGLNLSTLYPCYVSGEIYLAAGDSQHAEQEFRKLLDQPGMGLNFPLQSLAQLQVARAQLHASDQAKARDSYQQFLQLWKDADTELAFAKQARAEFQAIPAQ